MTTESPAKREYHIAQGPVQICQVQVELDAMLDLYRSEAPKRVLEIGTAEGGTLYHWLQNSDAGTRIVTVDLENPDYAANDHLYPEWTPDGVTVTQIRGDSHDPDVIDACRMLGPYQWLFIDAAHQYDDARQDFDNYAPMVSPGGLVLMHDIYLRRTYDDGTEAGAWRVWREVQASGVWTRELSADFLYGYSPDKKLVGYGIGVMRVPS